MVTQRRATKLPPYNFKNGKEFTVKQHLVFVISGMISLLLAQYSASAGDRICLEAESSIGIVEPMRIVDAAGYNAASAVAGAAGGGYLEIPKGAGNPPKVNQGEAILPFEIVEPGEYTLWCRVYWISECNSSFTLSLDDSLPFTFGKDATFLTWHWVKAPPRLKQMNLAKGKHVLTIRNRQDGVKLDQVLLALDKKYVPVGIEEATP